MEEKDPQEHKRRDRETGARTARPGTVLHEGLLLTDRTASRKPLATPTVNYLSGMSGRGSKKRHLARIAQNSREIGTTMSRRDEPAESSGIRVGKPAHGRLQSHGTAVALGPEAK